MLGRHDTAFANLKQAGIVGKKHGALGYLNTDWGDGGHLQPLAVSYIPYLLGAVVSWCAATYDENLLAPVLNRDIFEDATGATGKAAFALGFAHRKFNYYQPNVSPFGAVIAAPLPRLKELFCRDGLKYYARISAKNIQAAMEEVENQRAVLRRAKPASPTAKVLGFELDLAARMAVQSCKIMQWQQMLAAGRTSAARGFAKSAVKELRQIDEDFNVYWPTRNKGVAARHWPCLKWRIEDYQRGVLHFPPAVAAAKSRPD